jgi:hypothetical protein
VPMRAVAMPTAHRRRFVDRSVPAGPMEGKVVDDLKLATSCVIEAQEVDSGPGSAGEAGRPRMASMNSGVSCCPSASATCHRADGPGLERRQFRGPRGWLVQMAIGIAWLSIACSLAVAQGISTSPVPRHGLRHDGMAPGLIGGHQVQQKPHLRGYFQPVEVVAPARTRISVACDGQFPDGCQGPWRGALLVGAVYRLMVTGWGDDPSAAVYPTIEVIDRLYPLPEREHRFPIPIAIDPEDLERALEGELVTRVIYLEDSEYAEPVQDGPRTQRVHDIGLGEDALSVADQMGRPVAILRIGSRVPTNDLALEPEFLFGSPPWLAIKSIPNKAEMVEQGRWPRMEIVPAPSPAVSPSDLPTLEEPVGGVGTQGSDVPRAIPILQGAASQRIEG